MKRIILSVLLVLVPAALSAQVLADVVRALPPQAGGSSGGGLNSGTTLITDGTNTSVCFADGATPVLNCEDPGITFTKGSGTFATGIVSATSALYTSRVTVGSAADAANAVDIGETTGTITFEGSTADAFETRLDAANATADTIWRLPAAAPATYTVAALNLTQTWTAIQTLSAGLFAISGVEAVTTTKTTTVAEGLETYTNTGDADGATITLLNDPTIGSAWGFAVTVAQTLTIVPSPGESLYMGADQCLASITSNTIGSTLTIRAVSGGSGGVYMSFGSNGTWVCND